MGDQIHDITPGTAALTDELEAQATGGGVSKMYTVADLLALATAMYQPVDADLTAIAALASAANKFPYATGSSTWSLADLTAAGRALIDDADASAQRTTLGLGTAATLASDTDTTLAANSDSRLATQKAVKAYVDAIVTGLLDFKGSTDASANPNYPSALKGDAYYISVAGKVGGGSGKSVDVGDVVVASADNAGGTEASVGTSWFVLEHNLVGAVISGGALGTPSSGNLANCTGLPASAVVNMPYDVGGGIAGVPAANAVIGRIPFTRTVVFPSGLTASQGTLGTAATAQTDFDIKKNGSSVGTMRFAAAGTSASFIMASQTTFAAGDVLTVVAPASPDATAADLGFVLAGTR